MASPVLERKRLSPVSKGEGTSENHDGDTSSESDEAEYNVARGKPRNEARNPSTSLFNSAYNSNMFQLQIDELLSKVRPDYGRRMVRAENALRKLKKIIERIPYRAPKPVLEAEQSLQFRIPFPDPHPGKEAKYTLTYAKPANINVVGSYARRTAIQVGDQLVIDLAVTMPTDIFQDKDYLNYRYFHKRAYYLACIGKGIEAAEDCTFAIDSAYQNDSHLQPVIIVKPGQGSDDFSKSKCHIRIILAVEGDLFPIAKTLPEKNCIRLKVEGSAYTNSPTPFYNASLRSECSSLAYLKYLHAASLHSDRFSDACALGSVWLRQRSLWRGGFGAFEWACTMALLLRGGDQGDSPVLLRGYSSYQLFKATLKYIAIKDLVATPVLVPSDINANANTVHPVIFDGVRGMNILFKMTPWSYAHLRHEASLTLKVLDDPLSNQFDACFITRIDDPLRKFDCVISLPIPSQHSQTAHKLDAVGDDIIYCSKLYQALKVGLGDRAVLVHLQPPHGSTWRPGAAQQQSQRTGSAVHVGLLLVPEHVNRTVDRGPSAEDKEPAAAFRKFWGGKAELRRFKDGSIQESLTWSTSGLEGSVLRQIVTHIVRRHVGEEEAKGLEIIGESFDRFFSRQRPIAVAPVALYQPVMSAFETLEKETRSLEGLPLQVRQISAADPQLRYASIKTLALGSVQYRMDPANVCVQFEGSSRWPDDLSAVQRTKIAFLLKIGEVLEQVTPGLTTRLGLENAYRKFVNIAFLDILYPSGALFRMRIHHEREINLLQRTLKDITRTAASREEVASALSTYKRNFVQAPLHTQAVRTLGTRFPLLSPSMCLMKKWRDTHLLSGHISDELIEILTIRTFVHPYPWSVPGSLITGFLRTISFISRWDWKSDPLIVDFNGELNSQDINAIRLRFEAWRKIDPVMNRVAMFAASNVDRDGLTWTEPSPPKVVAARFTGLAKAACRLVQEQGLSLEPEALFAASMGDYDFVVHLNQKFVEGGLPNNEVTQPVFKNLQVQGPKDKDLVGFKPVQKFVEELKTLYGDSILFFHNKVESLVIAGLWNPQTGPRPWKVNLKYSTMPVSPSSEEYGDTEAQVSINKAATLHDIARLGGDIVSRIDVKK